MGDPAGEVPGVLFPASLQAPRVVAKDSKRTNPINFLFIHSSIFKDGVEIDVTLAHHNSTVLA